MRTGRSSVLLIVGCLGAAALWAGFPRAPGRPAAAQTPGPAVPVTEGKALTRDVPVWLSAIGSVQPLNAVTVKVRVDGQLDRVLFTEGHDVKAGEVLAQIDPRPFQAALRQAQANKTKDEAQLANARADLARFTPLEAKGVASRQSLDTARSQVAALTATVESDQAAIESARLQLEYSTIKSPLDGRAGLRLVDPGSIVHASDTTGLVTITQMQPIAALCTVSQDNLPEVLADMARGPVTVVAYTRDGGKKLAQGTLAVVDSQVDPATGQVKLKASFDNADRALWPGQFIEARVLLKTIKDATVIPAQAVERGQSGPYVFRIKADNTVEVVPIVVALVADDVAVVSKGVMASDRLVVEGQYRLTAGARIEPRSTKAAPPS